MKYPMKEVQSPFGGTTYQEMTPSEYEEHLQWFKTYSERQETCRRGIEYIDYLKRWFSEEECDGQPNFETRHRFHMLPMPMNIYFN